MQHVLSIRFMWPELTMPERACKAASFGFEAIEIWDWRTEDMDALQAACQDSGIRINGFFGHSSGGMRDPSLHSEVLDNLAESIEMAEHVGARQLHMFSDGIRRPAGEILKPPPITRIEQYMACIDGVRKAAKLVEGKPIMLILEAINTVHVPGYFWNESGITVEMASAVNHPQVRLSFDCFHQQLVAGRLTDNLIAALPWAGRIDVANVPGRTKPSVGEINYPHIIGVLEEHGYDGPICYETTPIDGDSDGCAADIVDVFKV